jgi:uncharacterized protein (TIGR03437 family)
MKSGLVLVSAALAVLPAAAQPFINYRGVVNAASFEAQGLPAGSIAQGSIFTIFGSNLGPAQYVQSGSFPLANQLSGVSVSVVQGTTTLAAIPVGVVASQVSAIMPSNAPLGRVIVRVSYNDQTSNPAIVNVVGASPGLFSILSTGFGPGVVQNFISATNQPVNTTQVTAEPGQTLILWGTGLGPVPYADNIAPTAGNLPTQVSVLVGGQPAAVAYSGRSPCCAGLDQIVFTAPANAPSGCYVPVMVTGNGVVSNAITIAINSTGAACADSFNPLGAALRAGGGDGIVSAKRVDDDSDVGYDPAGDFTTDFLLADFEQQPGGATFFNPIASLPPPGTCTTYSGGDFDGFVGTAFFVSQGQALNGGSALTVTAGGASESVTPVSGVPQFYESILGQQPTPTGGSPLFFNFPGTFTLTIPGGDVQTGQVQGTTPTPLQWTNRASLPATLTRANGLTITWSGGNPATDVALIGAWANNDPANSAALVLCVAPVTAGSFTVPSQILSTLPVTPASALRVPAWIGIASAPLLAPGTFSAGGLNAGFLVPSAAFLNAVVVQ